MQKGNLCTLLVEGKLVQLLWKTVWEFLKKKKKFELPYDPAFPRLCICLKKNPIIQKDKCTPMFVAILFTIVKIWKEPKCPSTDKWRKKMWCVCGCVCVYIYISQTHVYIYEHIYMFDSWIRKISWRRKWKPTLVFLPEECHEQRSLADYSTWCCKESDTAAWLTHTHF